MGKDQLRTVVNQAQQLGTILTGAAVAGATAFLTKGIELNRELQLQRLTLAADLELTTKIVDAHGKYVGQQKELNYNLNAASKMLTTIRKEAEATTLSEQELRAISAVTLAPTLRGGAKPEEGLHLIAQLANLAKIAGAQGEQGVTSEVRGVLGASPMVRRSRLGQILGLDAKELRQAQEAGTLVAMLTKKLEVAAPIIDRANASFDHLWSTLISKAQDFIQLATERVFERITGRVLDLNKAFTDESIARYAEIFSKKLVQGYDALESFVQSDSFKRFVDLFKYLVDHARTILEIFAGFKILQIGAAGAQVGKAAIGLGANALQAFRGPGGAGAAEGAIGGSVLRSVTGEAGTFLPGAAAGAGLGLASTFAVVTGVLADALLAAKIVRTFAEKHQADLDAARTESETRLMVIAAETRRLAARGDQRGFADLAGRQQDQMGQALPGATAAARAGGMSITPGMSAAEIASRMPGILGRGETAGFQRVEREQRNVKQQAETEALYLAKLRTKDRDDTVEKIHAKLSEEILASRKVLKSAGARQEAERLLRDKAHKELTDQLEEQRLDSERVIAEELGDKKSQARVEAAQAIKKTTDEVENETLKAARIKAINEGLARKLKEIDEEFVSKAKDNAKQYQDAITREAKDRFEMAKAAADLEKRTGRELVNIANERKQAIKDLYRTRSEEAIKARNLEVAQGRLDLRDQARRFLQKSGAIEQLTTDLGAQPSPVRERAEEAARERFRMERTEGRGNVFALSANDEREEATVARKAGDEAVQGEVALAIEKLIDQTVASGKFGLGGTARQLDVKEELTRRDEQREQVAEQANDIGKAFTAATKRVNELSEQQKELIKGYQESAKELRERFNTSLREVYGTLTKLAPEFQKLLQEITASHGVIPPAVRAILQRGTVAPSMSQVSAALGGPPHITTINITVPDAPSAARLVGEELRKQNLRTTLR
jgi:hypothetical protein